MGEYLSGGEYRRFDMRISEDGVAWGHSPILGLDLHWGEIRLHYFDPAEGEWLLDLREEQRAHQETRRRLRQLEEELRRREQP